MSILSTLSYFLWYNTDNEWGDYMKTIDRIQQMMPEFTKKEAVIAQFILDSDPIKVIQFTADQLASEAKSSKSAFIRMCQKLGYDGFSEFKFALSREMVSNTSEEDPLSDDPIKAITSSYAQKIMQINQMISKEEVHQLGQRIIQSRRVKILGYNRTALSATQLRMRLSKIGVDCEVISDAVVMKDVAGILNKDDLCIIFSIKGLTDPYIDLVKILQQNHCFFALITMTPKNHLVPYADQVVTLPFISRASMDTFLDDQAIFFVFIEILLNDIAKHL